MTPPVVGGSALRFWAVGALFVVSLLVLRVAAQAFLLTFAGVLFGTALQGLAGVVSRALGWRHVPSLAAALAVLLLLAAGAALWIIPSVANQLTTLADKVAQAYDAVRHGAAQSRLGTWLPGGAASIRQQLGGFLAQAAGILATTAGALGALVFVVFVALYVAGSPDVYRRGALRLVPPRHRARAGEILSSLATTLRRWLLGRLVSMTAVGGATALGLWLIGIPLPLTLGVIAGLLGFVPNFGPLASAVPAVLLAFTVGPSHVLYVAILYVCINLADGYVLTPWLQKRAVALPPALIIVNQVVMGALWGVLGLTLATPLSACLLVLTRELYVKDTLEGSDAG